jgi:hypothetical protein
MSPSRFFSACCYRKVSMSPRYRRRQNRGRGRSACSFGKLHASGGKGHPEGLPIAIITAKCLGNRAFADGYLDRSAVSTAPSRGTILSFRRLGFWGQRRR